MEELIRSRAIEPLLACAPVRPRGSLTTCEGGPFPGISQSFPLWSNISTTVSTAEAGCSAVFQGVPWCSTVFHPSVLRKTNPPRKPRPDRVNTHRRGGAEHLAPITRGIRIDARGPSPGTSSRCSPAHDSSPTQFFGARYRDMRQSNSCANEVFSRAFLAVSRDASDAG
jgi:hypothetical protein